MADALVSAVLETVLGIFSSVVLQEIGLLWGLRDELNSLESTLRTIKLVVQDAELKQRKSEVIHDWVRKLKDATYDAENILDRMAIEGLRRRAISERGMQNQLKSFLSSRNPLLFRCKMVREVKKIRGKLDAIAKERHELHLDLGKGVMENRFGVTSESRHTSSRVNESEIYGRHEEKEVIVEKLLDGTCDQDDPSVYAIQGMGGLGKTTLAQMVYNDARTETHFELRSWVCVSDDFSIQRIVRAILESIDGGGCNMSELDPLQRRLQERLRGRRFLLVLDDIWNENQRLWDELKEFLRCGSKGSVLMVTTRIEKVALMMATIPIHHINCLSEDDSWSLFRQRAFANGMGEQNFIAIGKAIVKKCGGVPLAIKALASLMRFKSHEREWSAIKESEIWHLPDDENAILPALRLSYDNLLPQMRQCFAYCCIFPKDYLMEENKLIQLWMANGYIPCDGQTDMHLTGRWIVKELVWRSFLQDAERDFKGTMRYKMHDLMHDLASSVMKHETYILEHNKVLKIPKTLRHLSFDSGSSWDVLDDKRTLKLPIDDSLRSIIVHKGNVPTWRKGFSSFLSKQQYLRALDVSQNYNIKKLPHLICKLEHLRYLAMACYNMKRLPESLTHLHNLQTLKLTSSRKLLELPKGMKVMKNLWFLEIEEFGSLICTPPGLGDLTCLRRLSIFIVGQDAPHQIYQLKDLDLGGELSIKGLDKVRNLEDARSANLMSKMKLTSLSLYWKNGIKKKSSEHFEEVLEGLQPHQNLEKMFITSYHGTRFPNWMSTLVFGKLKEISLADCPRCEHLPPLGKLPSLTRLHLYRMDSVKCWDVECYEDGETSFPALTSLTISEMPNLEEWTVADSVESFPCLEYLKIELCPKLTGLPKLPTLRELSISDSSMALLKSITSLASLTSLRLDSFEELDVFPGGLLQNHQGLEHLRIDSLPIRTLSNVLDGLSALKTLLINNCNNLELILPDQGLKYLSSLGILDISECDGLRSFPATLLEGLSSLRWLSFENCKKLKPLSGPLKLQAPALHELWIYELPELEYLPESMQQLREVRVLRIWSCKGLCCLPNWLGSLESLSEIDIWNCEKLKSLPDGFKSLKSLRKLRIARCPQLEKRCKKPKGEDWPKISHIPIIDINWRTIQYLDQQLANSN